MSGVIRDMIEVLSESAADEELLPCGAAARILRESVSHVRDIWTASEDAGAAHATVELSTETLHDLAQEQINAVSYQSVDPAWFRLYTDVAVVSALADLGVNNHRDNAGESPYLACIRRLDMAIIVAGAVGPYRSTWIHDLIEKAQKLYLAETPRIEAPRSEVSRYKASPDSGTRPLKRRRSTRDELELAPTRIPRLKHPPTIGQYRKLHREHPFILPDFLRDPDAPWPALRKWRDREYLEAIAGPGRVVPVEVGTAYTDASWGQQIMLFSDFLGRIFRPQNGEQPLYLAQHNLLLQFPKLAADIVFPRYVHDASAQERSDRSDEDSYRPPKDGPSVNMWIGGGNGLVTSPAHTDPYHNCFAQVLGKKRVWLAPPESGDQMRCEHAGSDGYARRYMTNTASLPILRQPAEEWISDPEAKRFKETVQIMSLEAVLEPGDLLVMPPGWWHAMRGEGEGPGWSVSTWF